MWWVDGALELGGGRRLVVCMHVSLKLAAAWCQITSLVSRLGLSKSLEVLEDIHCGLVVRSQYGCCAVEVREVRNQQQ